ncbi:MAG TPA: hypothetical protein P5181_01740 [Dermatophilaceae bacterium]|nr:hypothetical protein [Dermatophilaceae bacterium]
MGLLARLFGLEGTPQDAAGDADASEVSPGDRPPPRDAPASSVLAPGYLEARERTLRLSPVDLGVDQAGGPVVGGVVMDLGTASGIVTLVALRAGTAAIHRSDGTSTSSATDPGVVAATAALLAQAEADRELFEVSDDTALPDIGYAAVRLLTSDGPRVAAAAQGALSLRRRQAWRVYAAAHEVLAALDRLERQAPQDVAGGGSVSPRP